MFPGLIKRELESKDRVKKTKMQLRHKISKQTLVRNKIADLEKINGFLIEITEIHHMFI